MMAENKTVKIEPNWAEMFSFGEQLIKDADFDGKNFVLEMFQFGARCYITTERFLENYDNIRCENCHTHPVIEES